jgi:hypothetical protein
MINFLFLNDKYNEILNDLVSITENNIIIGGSTSLILQNAINRNVNDIDVNMDDDCFTKYQSSLEKYFNFYFMGIGNMYIKDNIIYTCKHLKTKKLINLFVTKNVVNYIKEIDYNEIKIKIIDVKHILLDKIDMVNRNQDIEKHSADIIDIKNYLNIDEKYIYN